MDWYPTPSYLVKRRAILDAISGKHPESVLEVGCGCGDLLAVLESRGHLVMGIDISQDALDVAAQHLANTTSRLVCCSVEQLSERFDLVIASEVLEHHQDDVGFLSSIGNLLNSGGLLVLTVPAHMRDWGANDDFCGHIRRYSRSELYEKLAATGFTNIIIQSYGVPIYNLMKPFYDRAIGSRNICSDQIERTADSGGMWLARGGKHLFRFLFNDFFMFPFYLLQRIFYGSDMGKGYCVSANYCKEIK